MLQPPNKQLMSALTKRLGGIKVAHEGEPVRIVKVPDPFDNSRTRNHTEEMGERYFVSCPFCGDNRKRCSVSYLFNTKDDRGRLRTRGFWMCFNEQCHKEERNRLEDTLKGYMGGPSELRNVYRGPAAPATETGELKETKLPGKCVLISRAPADHPAVRYVADRKFDPVALAKDWGVSVCLQSPNPLLEGRVIVPIELGGKLVAWQARAANDRDFPKYYTTPHFPKSRVLFNLDGAMSGRCVVVTEGVFDAFRVGKSAVCVFGKSVSTVQRELLRSHWRGVVFLLDADAIEDAQKQMEKLGPDHFSWGARCVKLTESKDPGDATVKQLRRAFREQLDDLPDLLEEVCP